MHGKIYLTESERKTPAIVTGEEKREEGPEKTVEVASFKHPLSKGGRG